MFLFSGHLFALMHGAAITASTPLKWPIIGFSIHAFISLLYVVAAILVYVFDDLSDTCISSSYVRALIFMVALFAVYVIGFVLTVLLVLCSLCECCSCLRIDSLAENSAPAHPQAGLGKPHGAVSTGARETPRPASVELTSFPSTNPRSQSNQPGTQSGKNTTRSPPGNHYNADVRWHEDVTVIHTEKEESHILIPKVNEKSTEDEHEVLLRK